MNPESDHTSNPLPEFSPDELKMPEEQPLPPEHHSPKWMIPALIVLIIVLMLILGGLYIWSTMLTTPEVVVPATPRPSADLNNEPESTTAEANVQSLQTVSTSDELGAIEADIEATDFNQLDAELTAIDAEMEAAE